jgi:hypothetical protein
MTRSTMLSAVAGAEMCLFTATVLQAVSALHGRHTDVTVQLLHHAAVSWRLHFDERMGRGAESHAPEQLTQSLGVASILDENRDVCTHNTRCIKLCTCVLVSKLALRRSSSV